MAENNYIAPSGRAVCSALCLVDSSDTTLAVVCICGRLSPRVKAPGHPTPVLEFNCIPLSPCLVDRGDTTHAVVRISGQQSSREKAPLFFLTNASIVRPSACPCRAQEMCKSRGGRPGLPGP